MSPIPLDARHIANQQGDFAPQHQNNFLIEIAGLDGDAKDLIVLSLVSAALPHESNDEVELPYGNEVRYVAGKAKFETIPLIVRDYVDRNVRKSLVDWRKKVYDAETGAIGLPSAYKKEATIIVVAPDNTHQRSCRLIGVWPQSMDGGTLDMSTHDPVSITLTLRYDRAIWSF